ncbi:MAG: nucleotidyltransferase, partial [Deltaproteobacteria bacterium]|nr:nucleotidyltransferase [Deltaproteobacteria bacterium]
MDNVIVQKLLEFLIHSPIDFVLIGGFAAVIHGSNQTTQDIDICILFTPESLNDLREALKPIHPHFRNDVEISFGDFDFNGSNKMSHHLETDLGILDLVSKVPGVGSFYDVLKNADEIEMFGGSCFVISMSDL